MFPLLDVWQVAVAGERGRYTLVDRETLSSARSTRSSFRESLRKSLRKLKRRRKDRRESGPAAGYEVSVTLNKDKEPDENDDNAELSQMEQGGEDGIGGGETSQEGSRVQLLPRGPLGDLLRQQSIMGRSMETITVYSQPELEQEEEEEVKEEEGQRQAALVEEGGVW